MSLDELVSYLSDKSSDGINEVLGILPAEKARRLREKLNELKLVGVA